jgi:hypothetical protein
MHKKGFFFKGPKADVRQLGCGKLIKDDIEPNFCKFIEQSKALNFPNF